MRSPSQLRRLQTLSGETEYGPGVDKLILLFMPAADLGVLLGDMNHFYVQGACKLRPIVAVRRHVHSQAGIGGDIEERLFDKGGREAGIRSMRQHSGRTAASLAPDVERVFPQGVVGT